MREPFVDGCWLVGWLIRGSLEGAWVHCQFVGVDRYHVGAQVRHRVGVRPGKEHPKQRSAADAH